MYHIERFHCGICHLAPKFLHFFHGSMKAKITLAALHHNENCNRKQAQDTTGELRWTISYPKYKEGGQVVKSIKEECSYDYIGELMRQVISNRLCYPTVQKWKESKGTPSKAQPLTSSLEKRKPWQCTEPGSKSNVCDYSNKF
ncbi:uncharacterized protein LOC106705504 isoform X1 [Latimeria chalumnae]|uniref:uncharacterized protein LOC106705504 isoform X1 n=1 Tax=Latimeria chalumnae TaxID=7897 RepID=UPI00313E15A9